MKRIAQILITIVAFLASAIAFDFIAALLVGDNIAGAFLSAFPGQAQLTYLDRYIGFMSSDTLGWFTYITLGVTQDLEIIAGGVTVIGPLLMYTPAISLPGATPQGLIPIMMEYHPWSSTPVYFMPALAWLLKLIGPFIVTGIVGGAVAKAKKDAMGNTFLAFLVIAIAGIVLNIVHVYMNWISVAWKFSATLTQNPAYVYFWGIYGILTPDMLGYIIGTSIVALVFAVINGLIISIISVIVARKK
nr:hypothetical protein [Candidatus Sigynarchaeota archaeon]